MLWKEVKSWCIKHDYSTSKIENGYSWYCNKDPENIFASKSVSKLARDVYNHMTSGIYLEHQASYTKEIKYEQPNR